MANLASSTLIELRTNIACSRVVKSAIQLLVGAAAKALMGDTQIYDKGVGPIASAR